MKEYEEDQITQHEKELKNRDATIAITLIGGLIWKIVSLFKIFNWFISFLISFLCALIIWYLLDALQDALKKNKKLLSESNEGKTKVDLFIPSYDKASKNKIFWMLFPFVGALLLLSFLVPHLDARSKNLPNYPVYIVLFVLGLYCIVTILRVSFLTYYDNQLRKFSRKRNLYFTERKNEDILDCSNSGIVQGEVNNTPMGIIAYFTNFSTSIPTGYVIRFKKKSNMFLLTTPKRAKLMAELPTTIAPYIIKKPTNKIKTGLADYDKHFNTWSSEKIVKFFNQSILNKIQKQRATVLIQDNYITIARHGFFAINQLNNDFELGLEILAKF